METTILPQRQAGYVCPTTGRVAVAVADLANSDLNGDVTAYWLDENAEFFGLDAWRDVEGIDAMTDGSSFDVCFSDGGSLNVQADALVYLRWSDAQRLAGGNKVWRAS